MSVVTTKNFDIKHFHNAQTIKDTGLDRTESRLQHLNDASLKSSIDGEILEFGVYKGTTINFLALLYPEKTIWGFDSFEGLPEDWKTVNHRNPFPKGHFKLDNLPDVVNNVSLIKGFFEKSVDNWLKEFNTKNIKILHIDCDLYSSTKTVLNNLNDKIIPGTIIIFDELYNWGSPKKYINWQNGEYLALKEWVEQHNREFKVLYRNKYMQSSIVIKK